MDKGVFLQKRRRPDSPATWYSLPEALAANIIARVAELSFRNIPTLRLVSKSWRDAMWAYQGLLSVRDEGRSHPEQMHTMCKILPHAGQLVIYSYMPIIMDSMRQLRRLRDVSLTFELHFGLGDKMEPLVDLSVLPPTVTKLALENIGLDMATIDRLKFTLSSLEVTFWEEGLPQTLALLSRQLKLEDLVLCRHGEVYDFSISPAFESHLGRLSSLTRLALSRVDMEHMAADPRFPPNLKELQLYAVYFSAQWASELVKASSNLTLLDMSHVGFLEGEGLPDFQPIRSLRRMVCGSCHPKLLGVAGPKLQSLKLIGEWGIWNQEELPEGNRFGRMSGMTKLELSNCRASHSQLTSLHSLKLRELVLVDCVNIEAAIFKPGALTALEVLHIDESFDLRMKNWDDSLQADPAEREASRQQLQDAGAVVLSLPKLQQLSGGSEAVATWMASGSHASANLWTKSKVGRQLIPGQGKITWIPTYTKV